MHIPDGFLSPPTYLAATGLALVAWTWAGRGLRLQLDEEAIPRLAALTALAYALGLVMLPLPGATSGHLIGVPMLALLFGVRQAFLAYSLVLLLQSLLFGAGGITALPVNALALGLLGAVTARAVFLALRRFNETLAVALAAWCATLLAAAAVGLVLGLQPLIARTETGQPLFFPFGWRIVLPAVLLPHVFIGAGEAIVTVLVWRFARARAWASGTPPASTPTSGVIQP